MTDQISEEPPPYRKKADRRKHTVESNVAVSTAVPGWSVRGAVFAVLGSAIGAVIAVLVTWTVMALLRSLGGVNGWSDWLGWGFALLPLLLFGLLFVVASILERPLVLVVIIGVVVAKILFRKQQLGFEEWLPERPLGGFDLTTMVTFAGLTWGLTGAIAGAMFGNNSVSTAAADENVSSK